MTGTFGALLEQEKREWEAARVYLISRGIAGADGFSMDECRAWLRKLGENRTDGSLYVRPLATYERKAVTWLRKPFFQGSAFHLLAGKKGQCKGTFLAGLAARVTTAKMYEDPRRVLVVTSEDSVGLDFGPRFDAAEGNDALCHIIEGDFRLPKHVKWLEAQARELGDVGLIAIDPVGNHLQDTNTDGEGSVRNAIAPLNKLADDLNCMIFGVRHLGKKADGGALSSVLGSTAWVDVPRCVIVMAGDDEDEMLFHAQVVAGNRGPRNAALAFRLELRDVAGAKDVTWLDGLGESEKDVNDLLTVTAQSRREASRSAKARDLILSTLERGTMASDELDAAVASETGLRRKTIQDLRTALKDDGLIRVFPDKDEHGSIVRWNVELRQIGSTDVGYRMPGDYGVAA